MFYEKRLKNVREKLIQSDIEAFLVLKPENIFYMCGFTGEGFLVVFQDNIFLFTDFRYIEQAKMETFNIDIIEIKTGLNFYEKCIDLFKTKRIRTLGIEAQHIVYQDFEKLKENLNDILFIKADNIIEGFRQIKDSIEIEKIKKAQSITDKAFSHILGFIKPGVKERDLALEMEFFIKKSGGEDLAFPTIVASGERSSLPHGTASFRKLREGDMITFDFGAKYNGYCSDMTRTVFLGEPSKQEKDIYKIVLEAQNEVLNQIGPRKSASEIDKIARNIIREHGYGECFGHSLGHGVGIEIHEEPRLSPDSQGTLIPGMVVTIEPGIYIEEFGGVRIEDLVLITDNGYENLTASPKNFIFL